MSECCFYTVAANRVSTYKSIHTFHRIKTYAKKQDLCFEIFTKFILPKNALKYAIILRFVPISERLYKINLCK